MRNIRDYKRKPTVQKLREYLSFYEKKNKQNNNIVTEINEAIFLLFLVFYFYLSTLHLFSVKGLT